MFLMFFNSFFFHYRPLSAWLLYAGVKLYCLVTETCTTCRGCYVVASRPGVEHVTSWRRVQLSSVVLHFSCVSFATAGKPILVSDTWSWRFGLVVSRWSWSTKLRYAGPG